MKRYNVFQVIVMGFIGMVPTVVWIIIAALLGVMGVVESQQSDKLITVAIALLAIAIAIVRWQDIVTVDDYKLAMWAKRVLLRKGTDGKIEAGRIFWRRRGDEFRAVMLPVLDDLGDIVVPIVFGKNNLPKDVTVSGKVHIRLVEQASTDRNRVDGFFPDKLWEYAQNAYSVQVALSYRFIEAAKNSSDVMTVLGRDYNELIEYVSLLHSTLETAMWSVVPRNTETCTLHLSAKRGRMTITLH